VSKKRKWLHKSKKAHKTQVNGNNTLTQSCGEKEVWSSLNFLKQQHCHNGPTEIIPNFWLGSEQEALSMPEKGVDVIFSLCELSGAIWNWGFRGRIYHYPIDDFEILPDDVANMISEHIINCLNEGHKVGLHCLGGHGRTGYIAALVLGRIGYSDPIKLLREQYCSKAVETNEQVAHIAKLLNKPEIKENYTVKLLLQKRNKQQCDSVNYSVDDCIFSKAEDVEQNNSKYREKCEDCVFYNKYEHCSLFHTETQGQNDSCFDFMGTDCLYYEQE
jgi:hypothetical protein